MLLATTLQLLLLVAGAAAGCANEGCAAAVSPVCGSDGLTYMNECLASCQDVTLVSQGSCVAGTAQEGNAAIAAIHIPAALFAQAEDGDSAATSGASVLPAAAISAYQSEGMRMIGLLRRSAFQPIMPALSEDMIARMIVTAPGTTMMVNSKGHLYAAPPGTTMQGPAVSMQQNRLLGAAAAFTAGDSFESLPPSDATAPILDPADINYAAASSSSSSSSDGGLAVGRKLAGIIGRDTRQEIRTTPKYPLSAAGHLMFTNPDDKQRYQCSGTLVGTFVVLTAAHCVVARSGEVQEDITFTAAETSRNHAGLGAANGVRVYFNSGYLGTGQDWTNWDLGMVVLDKPLGVNSHDAFQQELQQQQLQQQAVSVSARRGQGPSRRRDDADRHGGLSEAPGTVGYAASPRLDGSELISAGYPGDKPLGSAWMMTCSITDSGSSGNIIPNTCPIMNGQSGSSMIERRSANGGTRYYVRGVVSFEVCKSVCGASCCAGKVSYNGVLKITPFFQNFIDSHRNYRPNGGDSETE